jgi:hypothetical protein
MKPAVYKVDMIKGQVWRNKRNGQLERINHSLWNETTARTEHYLRSRVSDNVNKSDLEKVSHKDAIDYVQEQRKFEKLELPPLPLAAGV